MEDYQWLVVLAEEEHLSGAAARLGLAQPTLTRRLQALERDVGSPLFDRIGRGIALNDAGRIFADAARRAGMTLNTARARIAELNDPEGASLRLGFLHSLGPTLVPQLVSALRVATPHVRPVLVQDAADTIAGRVLDGDLDVGLISPPPTHPKLAFRRLVTEPVGVAVRYDHPLADAGAVSLADFASADWVTMPKRFGMRKVLDQAARAAQLRPRIAVECQELGTVAGMVSAGLGVALMPMNHMLVTQDVRVLPLHSPQAVSRDICLVWPAERALPRPARELIALPYPPV